jgi:hypothetical protein
MGVNDGVTYDIIIPWATTNAILGQLNDSASSPAFSTNVGGTSKGSTIIMRFGASNANVAFFRDGSQQAPSGLGNTSGLMPNANMYLLGQNSNGTPASSPHQVAAATIGQAFNGTSPQPAISSSGGLTGTGLVPRICTYLQAVHTTC